MGGIVERGGWLYINFSQSVLGRTVRKLGSNVA